MSSALDFNYPITANFFRNNRGNKLHFRYKIGKGGPEACLGSLFFLHGYAGHVDGPSIGKLIDYMSDRNIAVFCMDFEGHGHSEGERALIQDRQHLIEDFLGFVHFIMQSADVPTSDSAGFDPDFDLSALNRLRVLPFGVMGSSMGGAVTALVSNDLMKYPTYSGSILLAPALSINPPNWILVELLRHTVCYFTPTALMPSGLASVSDNRASLKHEEALARAELDTWGLPGALGWNKGMRWATALMFIDMGSHIGKPETLSSFRFPFLIIHDPGDTICSIDGSRAMMDNASTPAEDKKLVEVSHNFSTLILSYNQFCCVFEVPGYLHAILVNHPEEVCYQVLQWMLPRFDKIRKGQK